MPKKGRAFAISDTVTRYRTAQGLSHRELGKRVGVGKSMISQIESQVDKPLPLLPCIKLAQRIEEALGIPDAQLTTLVREEEESRVWKRAFMRLARKNPGDDIAKLLASLPAEECHQLMELLSDLIAIQRKPVFWSHFLETARDTARLAQTPPPDHQ